MTLETQEQQSLANEANLLSMLATQAQTLAQVLTVQTQVLTIVQGLPGGNNQQVLDAIASVNTLATQIQAQATDIQSQVDDTTSSPAPAPAPAPASTPAPAG